jgi:uncharacterized protein YjbI with pentapeptide repeats
MANPEHLEILKQGLEIWNQWRKDNPDVIPDLSGANLSGAFLSGARFHRTDLSDATLSKATLSKATLSNTELRRARLNEADLSNAVLSRADLTRARLVRANLSKASFKEANLSRARLSEADLNNANLRGANLKDAKCRKANLSMASLRWARLINTNLDGATLTGVCLWETQRAGWSIEGTVCEYVYWDGAGKEKSDYSPGEFERLFADKTKVRLVFKDGFDPLEFDMLPAFVKHLENSHPGIGLRMVGIKEDSGGVVVELAIEDAGDQSPEQLKQLKYEIETTARRAIEFERKFLAEEKIRGQLEARLDELRLWFGEQQRLLASANQFNIIGSNMGDTYNVSGQAGAVGQNAHAHDITFNQIVNHFEKSTDLPALAKQLAELREEMAKRQDPSPQAAIAQVEAEKAEIAANEGTTAKVVEYLKAGGQGLLDIAKETGKELLVAAIKTSMGLS